MSNNLYLYNVVASTTVLGAGKRFAIWVQGCDKRCPHCVAPDSQSKTTGGYSLSVEALVDMVVSTKDITGITISGGEPFLQSRQLYDFISLLNLQKGNMDYIVYSGYNYDELINNTECKLLLDNIDLLIDGAYIHALNENTPLIGSTNQGVYILSEAGKMLAAAMTTKQSREIEVVVKSVEEVFIIGIPPKNKLENIQKL
jgi:anaerobic ribonucleoside-triphosphate reductase activating protein